MSLREWVTFIWTYEIKLIDTSLTLPTNIVFIMRRRCTFNIQGTPQYDPYIEIERTYHNPYIGKAKSPMERSRWWGEIQRRILRMDNKDDSIFVYLMKCPRTFVAQLNIDLQVYDSGVMGIYLHMLLKMSGLNTSFSLLLNQSHTIYIGTIQQLWTFSTVLLK